MIKKNISWYLSQAVDFENKEKSSEALKVIKEIHTAFESVKIDGGVTLHETEILDIGGTNQELINAKKKDIDNFWFEVKDEWIESIRGVGGLCFLDELGFRYYLPAYMVWFVCKSESSESDAGDALLFLLGNTKRYKFDELFNHHQKFTIAKFLKYVTCYYSYPEEVEDAKDALDNFWNQYTKFTH